MKKQLLALAITLGISASALAADAKLVVTPDQRFAYVSNYGATTVSQYAVGANGILTPLSPATVTVGASPYGMVVNPDGTRLYVNYNPEARKTPDGADVRAYGYALERKGSGR